MADYDICRLEETAEAHDQFCREFRVILVGNPDSEKSNLLRQILNDCPEQEQRSCSNGITIFRGKVINTGALEQTTKASIGFIKFLDFGDRLTDEKLYPYFMMKKTLYIIVCKFTGQNDVQAVTKEVASWLEEIRRYAVKDTAKSTNRCPVILTLTMEGGNAWDSKSENALSLEASLKALWEKTRKIPYSSFSVIPLCLHLPREQGGIPELINAIVQKIQSQSKEYSDEFGEKCDASSYEWKSQCILRLHQKLRWHERYKASFADIQEALMEGFSKEQIDEILPFMEEKYLSFPLKDNFYIFPWCFGKQSNLSFHDGSLHFRWKLKECPDCYASFPISPMSRLMSEKWDELDLHRDLSQCSAKFRAKDCEAQVELEANEEKSLDIVIYADAPLDRKDQQIKYLNQFREIVRKQMDKCHLAKTEYIVFHDRGKEIEYSCDELKKNWKAKFFVPEGSCMEKAGKYPGKAILEAHYKKDELHLQDRNIFQSEINTFTIFADIIITALGACLSIVFVTTFLRYLQNPDEAQQLFSVIGTCFLYIITTLVMLACLNANWTKDISLEKLQPLIDLLKSIIGGKSGD